MATEEPLSEPIKAEWYYVGHYGQLGPLTLEQMSELANDGVIDAETYVWRAGMADWLKAVQVADLTKYVHPNLGNPAPFGNDPTPPPSPGTRGPNFHTPPSAAPTAFASPNPAPNHFGNQGFQDGPFSPPVAMRPFGAYGLYTATGVPLSDKNRYVAALLNILIPGLGRIYLGYFAHGALQMILALCGLGFVWSFFDAVFMVCGAVEFDGYGRKLP